MISKPKFVSAPQVDAKIYDLFQSYRNNFDSRDIDYSNTIDITSSIEKIRSAISDGKPFSMVRLGDGEGACLFFERTEYQNLRDYVLWKSLNLHFGPQDYQNSDYERFFFSISQAVADSDITTFSRRPAVYTKILSDKSPEIRGYVGATYANHFISDHRQKIVDDVYIDGYLHTALLPHYKKLLHRSKVVIVSSAPHDFCTSWAEYCDFYLQSVIRIPDQAANANGTQKEYLYPTFLDQVKLQCQEHCAPGIVFLIAAGLASKEIASVVRENLGIALDIGSAIDVLQGKGVRPYQTPDYLERHRIR